MPFWQWLDVTRRKLSPRSNLVAAVRHARSRGQALTRYAGGGYLEINRALATRHRRGPKHWLLAGSNQRGHQAASIYSLVETAKLNSVAPEAC